MKVRGGIPKHRKDTRNMSKYLHLQSYRMEEMKKGRNYEGVNDLESLQKDLVYRPIIRDA